MRRIRMQTANHKSSRRVITTVLVSLFCAVSTLSVGQSDAFQPNPAADADTIIVHAKFGGQIFGFDIDQNGTEGVLSEAKTLSNGNVLAAVETFDQTTGKILAVVTKTQTQDDFITLGVVGNSVGLVEHEHVISFLNVQQTNEAPFLATGQNAAQQLETGLQPGGSLVQPWTNTFTAPTDRKSTRLNSSH